MLVTCLGEALVDLVCERPVTATHKVPAFVPHFGGAMANVAVQAARHGADVALCGGVGDDDWGRWLRDQLHAAGVDVRQLVLSSEHQTPLALVTVDSSGEPSYAIYGSTEGLGLVPAADQIPAAVERAGLLLLSSNTLLGEAERALTMAARAQAIAQGTPFVVDVNLRPGRWADLELMRSVTLDLLDGAFLAKANRAEAEVLTGESDPMRAAAALCSGVATNAVVTSGPRGAVLRGEGGLMREVDGVPVVARNTAGAGDAVTGVLLASLAASDCYAPALVVA